MKEINKLREAILKDFKRFSKSDEFKFSCHCDLKCFNKCCSDVNIFLTPYDILRMKNELGISSQEFLDKYTIIPIDRNQKYPVVLLQMMDTDAKQCPFVDAEKGCTIYNNRPWACRMYPVGLASPDDKETALDEEFYFLLEDPICEGLKESKAWTFQSWMENQGVEEYSELGEAFKEVVLHPMMLDDKPMDPKKLDMFFMVCYNLDSFKRFVFESRFLQMFDVEPDVLDKIRDSDIELMKFGFKWLKFSLFGEKTMVIKAEVLEEKKKMMEKND